MSTFSLSDLADTLTFENLTQAGTVIHAGDRFSLRVDSAYLYTPWVSLYNGDIEPPATPGAVNPCNSKYLVGEGYSPTPIPETAYGYEAVGIFY